jgi:hypothetical protein
MRDAAGTAISPRTQGLTMRLEYGQIKLKNMEISERRQVGDAESMINEGTNSSCISGLFGQEVQV